LEYSKLIFKYSLFTFAILTPGDQLIFAAMLIATPLYVAVLTKFIYDYSKLI